MLQTYTTNKKIRQGVEQLRRAQQREEDLNYLHRSEESHAKCDEYLTSDQLVYVYIESIDAHICPYLRKSREDRKKITALQLCGKATNQGENTTQKYEAAKDRTVIRK